MAINPKIIKPRAAADLKPTDLRAQILRNAQQDKLRKDADKFRKAAKEQAADKKIRPAKDIKKGDARSKFLKDVKSGKIKAATPATKAGTSVGSRVSSFAKGAAGRALGAAGFYFGDTFGKSDLNRGETEFMEMIKKKAGKGYGDKPVGPFKPDSKPSVAVRKASGTYTSPYDVKEAPKSEAAKSGFGSRISERAKLERLRATRAALDKKPAESPYIPKPTPKPQDAVAKSAEEKTVKTASDKSRLAPKLTNYQRMQAKQFEKEGYAGRSLTRAQSQKLAGVKTASNTSSLMNLFGISKKKTETPKATTPNKLASDFAKKNLAANQKIGKSK